MRQTSSGLDIPADMNDRFVQAEVISASTSIGKEEFGIEKGQTILYDKFAGHEFKGVDNKTYRAITCRDVAVIL